MRTQVESDFEMKLVKYVDTITNASEFKRSKKYCSDLTIQYYAQYITSKFIDSLPNEELLKILDIDSIDSCLSDTPQECSTIKELLKYKIVQKYINITERVLEDSGEKDND